MTTLADYLELRGKKAKALTKGEAGLLGIPYPLQAGWPRRYGAMEIEESVLGELAACVQVARLAAEERARSGKSKVRKASSSTHQARPAVFKAPERTSPVPGFALRRARRFRKSAPWA